jgi:hypothetical protein
LRGVTNIDAGDASGIVLFVYTAEALTRDFIDSDEGTLEWIPLGEVFQKDLVEDLPILLRRLFGADASADVFSAHSSYNADDKLVMRFFD